MNNTELRQAGSSTDRECPGRSSKSVNVVTVSAYYAGHGGGVERVAFEIISRMAYKEQVRLQWLALDSGPGPSGVEKLTVTPLGGSNFVERRTGLPFPLIFPSAIKKLHTSIKKADIVHIHDFVYSMCIISWLFARWYKIPVVITQHTGEKPFKNPVFRVLLQTVNQLAGKKILQKSAAVVFISNKSFRYFSGADTDIPSRWEYLPNGVDFDCFYPVVRSNSFKMHGTGSNSRHTSSVLFVGRFVMEKGLHIIRELAERTPEIRWILAGQGKIDPGRWNLPNVTLRGHLDQKELADLYRQAGLLFLPSIGEGFPLVIQEAVSCKLPVLTNTDTCRGCKDAFNWLHCVDMTNSDYLDRFEKKLRDILFDETFNSKVLDMAEAGFLYAEKNWSWDRVVGRYHEMFMRITMD